MASISETIQEFRQVLLKDQVGSFEFAPPASEDDLAAFEDGTALTVPDDLRELWQVSENGYWCFSQLLFDPSAAIEWTMIINEEALLDLPVNPEASVRAGKVIAFGSHAGEAICYLMDGPDAGAIAGIDPQNPQYPVKLGDSLDHYLTAIVAMARAGHLRTETQPILGSTRMTPRWASESGSYIEVPDDMQRQLGIGPLFY